MAEGERFSHYTIYQQDQWRDQREAEEEATRLTNEIGWSQLEVNRAIRQDISDELNWWERGHE